jgi:hypothetical protein
VSRFAEVDDLIAASGNLTRLFGLLKPLARAPIGPDRLDALRRYFRAKDQGLAGHHIPVQTEEVYAGQPWGTYYEWFTRRLRPDVLAQLTSAAASSVVSTPVESAIESVGRLADPSSIVRLKKPAEKAKADLASLGVPASHLFVNMKLLTSHYHFVHAPLAGVLKRALPIHASMPLFGRVSLNFVEIEAAIGPVFLLIVGEAVVQDFTWAAQVGDRLGKLDPIGNFAWGSQVVMLFPGDLAQLRVRNREYAFMGRRVL